MLRKSIQAVLATTLALAAVVAAGQQPPAAGQPNTVQVAAEGRYEAPPDTALLQFDIAPQEDTPRAAYEHASRAAEQVRQVLRSQGVDLKAAEVGFFSLAPVYDWRQPKRKLIAYRVTSAVTVKLKDFEKVGPLVQQLADIDVTENQMLNYVLENLETAKVKAVQDAYAHARAEAEALAQAGGRTLGELSYGAVDTYEPVRVLAPMSRAQPRAMVAGAAAEQPPAPTAEFSPQRIAVTARVNTVFTLK
jgi:hypothetical protein